MRAAFFLLIFFIILINSTAQNLEGVWRGTLTQGPGGCFRIYNIELNIKSANGKLNGASYHYSDVTNYVKEDFGGSFNSANKTLTINELKVLTFHVPPDCIPCIKQYNLVYEKQDNKEVLTGDWGGVTMNNYASCPPGKITLSRVAESDFEHIKEIRVDTGKIRLDFYDNAQVDGDIITVLLNNKPLASNQKLTAKPITLEVKVDLDNREQEVTMVAENLGDIPPNTALLIITAGTKRYQLYLTSTEKKNAQVRFIYEDQKNNQ
ncbi:MAG TPA: hypothetical protein VF144_08105 [Chitinophagaceae bacterium]